jgi:hypothetical protein
MKNKTETVDPIFFLFGFTYRILASLGFESLKRPACRGLGQ